jgi:hypothetical protein
MAWYHSRLIQAVAVVTATAVPATEALGVHACCCRLTQCFRFGLPCFPPLTPSTGRTAQLVAKYRPPMPIVTLVVPKHINDGILWRLEGR